MTCRNSLLDAGWTEHQLESSCLISFTRRIGPARRNWIFTYFTRWLRLLLYIYREHICCKVKNWSKSCPFLSLKLVHYFFPRISFSLQKEEYFSHKQKGEHQKKLKIGPILLRSMLGPVFNFNLDQFLTLEFVIVCCVCVFLGEGLKPLFL